MSLRGEAGRLFEAHRQHALERARADAMVLLMDPTRARVFVHAWWPNGAPPPADLRLGIFERHGIVPGTFLITEVVPRGISAIRLKKSEILRLAPLLEEALRVRQKNDR